MNRTAAVNLLIKHFEINYAASDLWDFWRFKIQPAVADIREMQGLFRHARRTTKKQAIRDMHAFWSHEQAFEVYEKSRPELERQAYSLILHYGPMSMAHLADYLAEHDFEISRTTIIWDDLNRWGKVLPIRFSCLKSEYEVPMEPKIPYYHDYFYIPKDLRPALQCLIPKPTVTLHSQQGQGLQLASTPFTTPDPHALFDTVRGFKLKGAIKYKKGSFFPTKASAKALKANLDTHHQSMHPDLDAAQDLHYEELAIATIAQLMPDYQQSLPFMAQLWTRLKTGASQGSVFLLDSLLTHIKTNDATSYWSVEAFVEPHELFQLFTDFFESLAPHRIYTLRDLDFEFRQRYPSGDPIDKAWHHFYCYPRTEVLSYFNRQSKIALRPQSLTDVLVHPFMKMICTLTAHWGMAEVWFSDDYANTAALQTGKNTFLSPYDDVIAWRLNENGAYVLGHTGQKPKGSAPAMQQTQYHLDDQHLVITRTGPTSSIDLFLSQLAERIGDSRYLVSVNSFRKGCNTVAEIQERKDNFRRELGVEELPRHWQVLLADVLQRAEPLERVEGYLIYRINEHPHLRELFATDPVLREISLKAEGHLVLVRPGDVYRVLDVLRKNGFST